MKSQVNRDVIKLLNDKNDIHYLTTTKYGQLALTTKYVGKSVNYEGKSYYNSMEEFLKNWREKYLIKYTILNSEKEINNFDDYQKVFNTADKLLDETIENIKKHINKKGNN